MTVEEIKARMKEKGLKQADLCRRWNRKPSTVHELIHRRMKSAALERRLARALGVPLEQLRNGQ